MHSDVILMAQEGMANYQTASYDSSQLSGLPSSSSLHRHKLSRDGQSLTSTN